MKWIRLDWIGLDFFGLERLSEITRGLRGPGVMTEVQIPTIGIWSDSSTTGNLTGTIWLDFISFDFIQFDTIRFDSISI